MAMFKYIRIPCNDNEPLECLQAEKAGGLTNDELVKQAKQYFSEGSPMPQRDSSSPGKVQMMKQSDIRTSCEITAVSVPTPKNGHTAVSMYSSDSVNNDSSPVNHRAIEILTACGHDVTVKALRGDVFIGRAHDDEMSDMWSRVDFTVEDADATADWCRTARSPGGGGGQAGKAASSLNGLLSQQMNNPQIVGASNARLTDPSLLYGLNGAPAMKEAWGSWTQTEEDVEAKFPVPEGTKGRQCRVEFSRNHLRVTVDGKMLLEGATFDPVCVDDCTFTLQDETSGRELCVTLTKANQNRTWSWVVQTTNK